MAEVPVSQLRLTSRSVVTPGATIRVVKGSGPTQARQPLCLLHGVFRVLRLYSDSRFPKRLYLDGVDQASGRTHTIYVAGPAYRATWSSAVLVKPYRVRLITPVGLASLKQGDSSPRTRRSGESGPAGTLNHVQEPRRRVLRRHRSTRCG